MKRPQVAISCTALVCVTALLGFALYQGINGALLATGMAIIAGIAGFVIPSPLGRKKED